MADNKRSTTPTSSSTATPAPPAGPATVRQFPNAAAGPFVTATNSGNAPTSPVYVVNAKPQGKSISYVVNVRAESPKHVIRKANEILQREDDASQGTPTTG